ncbi:efflux RND transporter periplasmic adaptor subunit [Actinomycetospora sp. CA-101289]|uniref:efflux RND transporter periplasmic adaptor subunit n=1 Tax=Actinomycetospora sp. CA-101289 TaxID=3239893 RepID=UPI003D991084
MAADTTPSRARQRPRGPRARAIRLGALAVSTLAAGAVLAACGSSTPAAPRTVAVARGSVSTAVSAVGSVSAGQVNVGFPQGGQLTSVAVKVGDHVTRDQVLATIDDFAARQALRQAEAQLDAQNANLEQAEDSTSVDGAEAALAQARRVLAATERVAAQPGPAAGGAAGGAATGGAGAGASQATGALQVEQARQGVVSAQNNLDAAEAQRPHTLDAARAAVDGARAGVNTARENLANTTLRAPSDGVVTALNGVVGEFVGTSSGTTARAPGSDAAIPGAPAASAAGAAGATAGGATPTRPGGAQFVVLDDPAALQVVVPFQESDAAAIAPGQHVDVTVDAIPDAALGGTVQAVAPSGAAISNVVNYYVTVALTGGDPRLREGQTARASVVTGHVDGFLTVPNAAVRRQGTSSSVVVVGPGGRQQPVRFTPGLVGTDRTQVLAGLQENQQILVTGGRSR